jgi:hypothetical protein
MIGGKGRRLTPGQELVLSVRPIPRPLWGLNLRAALGTYRWSKVRRGIIAERGLACETCGKKIDEPRSINAHECWSYHTIKTPAVARLDRITLDCWHCHACEHFPRTVQLVQEGVLSEDAIGDTIAHWCRLNGATPLAFDRHFREAMAEWVRLSAFEWTANYGIYALLIRQRTHAQRRVASRDAGRKGNLGAGFGHDGWVWIEPGGSRCGS